MSTSFTIAILFFVLGLVFLLLGIKHHNRVFLTLGLSFMLTAMINGVVSFTVNI